MSWHRSNGLESEFDKNRRLIEQARGTTWDIHRKNSLPPNFDPHSPLNQFYLDGLKNTARAEADWRMQMHKHQLDSDLRNRSAMASVKALAQRDRLIVPIGDPIPSSRLIPTLFNINRLGYNRPLNPLDNRPKINRQQIDAQPKPNLKSGQGIVVYGISQSTGQSVPILVIKTKLVNKEIETQLTTLSNDVITHKPVHPLEIDLSQYDNIRDIKPWFDAAVINIGGDFAFGGGLGAGLQIIVIVKGTDQGIYVYRPEIPNANIGLILSVGMTMGTVSFNHHNNVHQPLDRRAFIGNSQGWSGGYGPVNGGVFTSYTDGKWHGTDVWRMKEDEVLYRMYAGSTPGMGPSFDIDFGAQYSFTKSKLWLSFPFSD